MKRVLVIRLLTLELAPIVAAMAISAYSQTFMAPAFLAASLVIFSSVILSIRDGAVLERYGYVCEKRQNPSWFWFWISAHSSLGLFFLTGAAMMLLYP